MKKYLLWFWISISLWSVNAQINIQDSTAQVVGYWATGDQQQYLITYNRFKMTALDTVVNVGMTCNVKIGILEVNKDFQDIAWTYTDVQMDTDNALTRLLGTMIEDLKIVIRTDEYGVFREVVNWEEVTAFIQPLLEQLMAEFGEGEGAEMIRKAMQTYLTREGLESSGIQDVLQFYRFHGGRYRVGALTSGIVKVPNQYGGSSFDANVEIGLEELNAQEDYIIIRAHQEVDATQLTEATVYYLKTTRDQDTGEEINTSAMELLTDNTYTAAQIHGSSGWPVYSVETRVVRAGSVGEIEERIIQLQTIGK